VLPSVAAVIDHPANAQRGAADSVRADRAVCEP
jgi:hypothetical protein